MDDKFTKQMLEDTYAKADAVARDCDAVLAKHDARMKRRSAADLGLVYKTRFPAEPGAAAGHDAVAGGAGALGCLVRRAHQ